MEQISADQLVKVLAVESVKCIQDDVNWKLFGFKKAPKRGSFFNKFVAKEKLMIERFFRKEMFILAFSAGVVSLPDYFNLEFLDKFSSRGINIIALEVPEIAPAFGFNTGNELASYFHRGVAQYCDSDSGKMDTGHFVTTFNKRGMDELGESFNSKWVSVLTAMFLHPDSFIMDKANLTGYNLENKELIDDL